MKYLFVIMTLSLFFCCQGSYKGTKTNGSTYYVGKTIRTTCEPVVSISAGDTLIVEFTQYPSRAYTWYINQMDTIHSQLRYTGLKTFSQADLDGAPEKVEYIFKAMERDSLQLHFKYQRPWERNKPAVDSCIITVVIQ